MQFDESTSIGRLLFDHRLVCDVPPLPFLPSQKRMFVNGKQTSPSSLLRLPDGKGPIPGTMAAQVPHSDALEGLPTYTHISARLTNPLPRTCLPQTTRSPTPCPSLQQNRRVRAAVIAFPARSGGVSVLRARRLVTSPPRFGAPRLRAPKPLLTSPPPRDRGDNDDEPSVPAVRRQPWPGALQAGDAVDDGGGDGDVVMTSPPSLAARNAIVRRVAAAPAPAPRRVVRHRYSCATSSPLADATLASVCDVCPILIARSTELVDSVAAGCVGGASGGASEPPVAVVVAPSGLSSVECVEAGGSCAGIASGRDEQLGCGVEPAATAVIDGDLGWIDELMRGVPSSDAALSPSSLPVADMDVDDDMRVHGLVGTGLVHDDGAHEPTSAVPTLAASRAAAEAEASTQGDNSDGTDGVNDDVNSSGIDNDVISGKGNMDNDVAANNADGDGAFVNDDESVFVPIVPRLSPLRWQCQYGSLLCAPLPCAALFSSSHCPDAPSNRGHASVAASCAAAVANGSAGVDASPHVGSEHCDVAAAAAAGDPALVSQLQTQSPEADVRRATPTTGTEPGNVLRTPSPGPGAAAVKRVDSVMFRASAGLSRVEDDAVYSGKGVAGGAGGVGGGGSSAEAGSCDGSGAAPVAAAAAAAASSSLLSPAGVVVRRVTSGSGSSSKKRERVDVDCAGNCFPRCMGDCWRSRSVARLSLSAI